MPPPATIPPVPAPLFFFSPGPPRCAITTMVTLISPPAPMPCRAREAISQPIDGAAPHSAEPARKVPRAPRKTCRGPRTSQSLPYSGSIAADASEKALISQGILAMPCSGSRSLTIGTVAADTICMSRTASTIVTRQARKPILRWVSVMGTTMPAFCVPSQCFIRD